MDQTPSTVEGKEPCPECRKAGRDRTGDNLVVYAEGRGAHCFACGYHDHGDQQRTGKPKISEKLNRPMGGEYRPLKSRKIDEKTCRLYGYRLAKFKCGPQSKLAKWNGTTIHVADYWRAGSLSAQHIRFQEPKDFRWRGDTDMETMPLFGQWLWNGQGKRIVITEGEIDCLTISMLWKNRWPVVSIPSGVKQSEEAIRTNLQFLSGYDEIVLAFDNDEQGRLYAEKCAEILPPGRVRICHFPLKDANDMHRQGKGPDVLAAIYEARQYQPDGILHASDIVVTDSPVQQQWTFPWGCLTRGLMGQRSGEITMWTSPTGGGKSTLMREVMYHHLVRGRRVGMLMLEESPAETLDDLIAIHTGRPVRQMRAAEDLNQLLISEGEDPIDFGFVHDFSDEDYEEARQWFAKTALYIYDHHGTNEFGNVLQRVEYLAAGLECDVVVLDHVTAVVAGMDRNGSERECLDEIMRKLRSITERTGVHIDVVSQLNRLDGKAAEEGGQISMKNLRGSQSLGSVPNTVLAVERNMQADDPEERRTMKVRVLKGRFVGETGVVGLLRFNPNTRRLEEAEWAEPGVTDGDDNVGSTIEPEDIDAILDPTANPGSGGSAAGDATIGGPAETDAAPSGSGRQDAGTVGQA